MISPERAAQLAFPQRRDVPVKEANQCLRGSWRFERGQERLKIDTCQRETAEPRVDIPVKAHPTMTPDRIIETSLEERVQHFDLG